MLARTPSRTWIISSICVLRRGQNIWRGPNLLRLCSRSPLAFPCSNKTTATVIKCLAKLFVLCGTAGFIYSDNGPSFCIKGLENFFYRKGVENFLCFPYIFKQMQCVLSVWDSLGRDNCWNGVEGHSTCHEIHLSTTFMLGSCSWAEPYQPPSIPPNWGDSRSHRVPKFSPVTT